MDLLSHSLSLEYFFHPESISHTKRLYYTNVERIYLYVQCNVTTIPMVTRSLSLLKEFGYAQCNVATIPMVTRSLNLLKEFGYAQCNVVTIPMVKLVERIWVCSM